MTLPEKIAKACLLDGELTSNEVNSGMTLADKILKACAVTGTHTPDDIQDAIDRGEMGAFVAGETLVVATVNIYPQRKLCELFMIAGDLDEAWQIVDDRVIPWAKKVGCDGMLGRGRDGWRKRAKERGWQTGTVATFDFEDYRNGV